MPLLNALQPCCRVLGQLQRPLLSLTLSLSLATAGLLTSPVGLEALADSEPGSSVQTEALQPRSLQTSLADGIYFYGQVPHSGELGAEYLVFQVVDQKAVGAFFMPSSSYDCFHGEIAPEGMNLTIVGSYDQTTSDYAIALNSMDTLTAGETVLPVALVGYHAIESITPAEQELLATCVNDLQPELEL